MATRNLAPAAPQRIGGLVNLGDDTIYGGGGGKFDLVPGLYALELWTQMFQPSAAKSGRQSKAFPAVMVRFHPLDGTEPAEPKPLGLGGDAASSFVPSADQRGFDPVAGGRGKISGVSAWTYFRKSLIDSGVPKDLFQSDLKDLDGLWVRTDNMDEPKEKKDARENAKKRGRAGEAAGVEGAEEEQAQQSDFANKVLIVTEIPEGGDVWNGGGGFDFSKAAGLFDSAPAAPAPPARNVPPTRTAPPIAPSRMAPPVRNAPAAPSAPAGDEEDVETSAMNLISEWLEKNATGGSLIQLRTFCFTTAQKKYGKDTAQAVQQFNSDANSIAGVLGALGYALNGTQVQVDR